MPTKTFLKPAATISAHSSGSSARFTDASVRKPILVRVRCRHSIKACSSALVRVLLPMKLSSTMNTMSFHPRWRSASSSAINCGGVFVRGVRPFITMMSQNSQSKGQPRENCTDIVT